MDYKARLITRELVDNDRETPAVYSDGKIVLALYRKKTLSLNELLRLMKVRRAQRYRRLKRLVEKEYIELYPDPNPTSRLKKRKMFARLTTLGVRIGRLLVKEDHFKGFRVIIPKKHETVTPVRKQEIEKPFPLRKTIFEVLEDEDDFVDEEPETKDEEFVDDYEDDESFDMDEFLETIRSKNNG